jgi:hypothetical protein
MSAARAKHPTCVQLLVEKGVNVNPKKEVVTEVKETEDEGDAVDFSIPLFNHTVH